MANEFLVDLGDGQAVLARQPGLSLMALRGLVGMPLLNSVVKAVGDWAGAGADASGMADDAAVPNDKALGQIDAFVAAALVRPKVVLAGPAGGDVLLASDLTLRTKQRIVVGVMAYLQPPEVVAAATEFPAGRSGARGRPDVSEVSAAPF